MNNFPIGDLNNLSYLFGGKIHWSLTRKTISLVAILKTKYLQGNVYLFIRYTVLIEKYIKIKFLSCFRLKYILNITKLNLIWRLENKHQDTDIPIVINQGFRKNHLLKMDTYLEKRFSQ